MFDHSIPKTPTWKSPRGNHRLFNRPAGLPDKAVVKVDGIEFRIGNALSILPPSADRYWLKGKSLAKCRPAELPRHVVDAVCKHIEGSPIGTDDNRIIPQGRRNTKLTAYAGAMRRSGLECKEILAALRAVNKCRCSPPLPDSEVRSIADSVGRYAPGGDATIDPVTFPRITAAELASAKFDCECLIDDVLYGGQPFIIGGPSKSLKTSLAVDLCLSLASGKQFLNTFPVADRFVVGLMSGESGLPVLQETSVRVAAAKGFKLKSLEDKFVLSDKLPRIGCPGHDVALRRWADGLDVLIVDPSYMALDVDGQESSMFAVGRLLRSVSEFADDLALTVGLVHHSRQSIRNLKPPAFNDLAWAGFEQWSRQWLMLKRRKAYQPGTGRHRLWFSVGGSAGHSGLYHLDIEEGVKTKAQGRHWNVEVSNSEHAQSSAAASHKAAIVNVLRQHPDGANQSTIRKATGMNGNTFRTAADALLADGTIALNNNVYSLHGTVELSGQRVRVYRP